MTPNRLIMSVAPAESATVPRRPGSGHRPTDVTQAENSFHDGATQQCKQRPASPRPRQIADMNPTRRRRASHRHGSGKPLD